VDKVKAMQTFVRIVEANSFSKAAETLGLPRASLTATMQNLEGYLGTQLLQRTTRRLSLTPDGAAYFRECVEILAAIENAERSFRGADARRPKGKLRVELPTALARHLILPRLGEFHRAYPELELAVSMTDRLVDLMQEGIDCAVRVGALQDSSMIGRQIGIMRILTCASPGYLAQYGTPQSLDELHKFRGIVHFSGRTGRPFDWEYLVDGKLVKLPITGPIAVSAAEANVLCALQGLGLAQVGAYQVREALAAGDLVVVLPETPPTAMPISLLYPPGRMAAPKLSVFAGWLATLFEQDPDLCL
jgi:LysR family transcriptional regulator for bpeEF and oprC